MSNSRDRPIVISDVESADEDESSPPDKRIRISSSAALGGPVAVGSGTSRRETSHARNDAHAKDVAPASPAITEAVIQPQHITSAGLNALSRKERKLLEEQRRERQRQRRRSAVIISSSDDESGRESQGRDDGAHQPSSKKPSLLPPFSASRPLNRTCVTEITTETPTFQPVVQSRPVSIQEDRSTGASSWGIGATSGLGTSTKPALRRILADERFWSGVVKRSYNQFTADGVPFSDFFLPTTKNNSAGLLHAVVASYTYEWDWLETILPSGSAGQPGKPGPQFTFVTLEKPGVTKAGVYQLGVPGWVLLAIKSLGTKYSSMHVKMALLFYANRLRLVIMTGNFQASDWEVLENAAYVQDFPILAPSSKDTSSDVFEQLSMVLRGMDIPPEHYALKNLANYNLSKGPTLVASVGSQNPIADLDQIKKLGLGRLNEKVREILGGAVGYGGLDLEAQGSSMGTYSLRWLQQVHLLASGMPLSSCLLLPKADAAATRHYLDKIGSNVSETWPPIKVIFPTDAFVRNHSVLGAEGGGCHFGKPEKFQKWRQLCYHAKSTRHSGILMHQKGLLGLRRDFKRGRAAAVNADPEDIVGFVLMSSANFTSSAWGNISQAASGGLQMTSSNWELGVFFPLKRIDLEPQSELSSNARSSICWRRPAKPYGPGDVPWTCFA